MKDSFSRAASAAPPPARANRPPMPSAEALLKQGITSRATIGLMASQNPPAPRMEPRPGGSDLGPVQWEEACRAAQQSREDLAQQVRSRFEGRAQHMQQSFRQRAQGLEQGQQQGRSIQRGMER